MTNANGTLYHMLKTHNRVDNFRCAMNHVLKHPEHHHPALVSIAKRLMEEGKPLSIKQIVYTTDLLRKTVIGELFNI